jgi:hypothetical protein
MASEGTTAARGYGGQHQALRADYKRRMAQGERFICWRCGHWLDPHQPWDLGHDDHDRTQYRGPEHRGRECPMGGNRATNGRRVTKLRRWNL